MTSSSRLRAQHTKLACNFIIASYNFCCCLFTFHFSCLLCCFALWNACMRKHSQSSTMNRPIPNEKKKMKKIIFLFCARVCLCSFPYLYIDWNDVAIVSNQPQPQTLTVRGIVALYVVSVFIGIIDASHSHSFSFIQPAHWWEFTLFARNWPKVNMRTRKSAYSDNNSAHP